MTIITTVSITLICLAVMTLLWLSNRNRYKGLAHLPLAFLLQFLSVPLLTAGDHLSPTLTLAGGSLLLLSGTTLLVAGLMIFVDKTVRLLPVGLTLLFFVLVQLAVMHLFANIAAGDILLALALFAVSGKGAWLMLRGVDHDMRPFTCWVGYALLIFALVALGHLGWRLTMMPSGSLLEAFGSRLPLLRGNETLTVLLTFSLLLMVIRRLFWQLEADLAENQRMATELRQSEEKFAKAFQASPDAVSISRLIDGRLVEGNETFCRLSGYSREEMIGATTVDLGLWNDPEERQRLIDALITQGRLRDYRFDSLNKLNQLRHCLFFGEIIALGGEPHIFSIVRDITEKLQAEASLKRKNQIMAALQETTIELLAQLDIDSLLENIVKRADALIGTSGGYLDLVDEESGQLRPKVGIGLLAESLNYAVQPGEGVAGTVWQSGTALVIDDYDQWSGRVGVFSSGKIKAVLGVPLLSQDKILGVLGLAHAPGSGKAFSPEDLEILTQFSRLVVIAISNARLYQTAQRELGERRLAEEALRENERRLRILFENLPVGVSVQDPLGRVVYANPALSTMLEMEREEILSGSCNTRQHLRPDKTPMPPEESADSQARRLGLPVHDIETGIVTERGKTIWVNVSAAPYPTVDQGLVIATVDITVRKQAEEAIRLCLRLWEFASSHSLPEVLQRGLDEIESLTDSCISFYHFVDDDQENLTLGAWSTRTKKEFCQARGEGQHYPLTLAGVWTECFHRRTPVIHNDYSSLPNKKGMPDGHASVLRQLVVPTIRDGKVVSILGVGNKAIDYDLRDAELVSYIADLVYSIVENERAEAQIHQLNNQLQRLAMTDELTGLANRRAFFVRGEEELKMARRYAAPLSLLMLDIDRFKGINDTYGHHVGDQVLQLVANTMQTLIREVDKLGRIGGEEFAILLPKTGPEEASRLAERLRRGLEKKSLQSEGQTIGVTISIGVAPFCSTTKTLDDLLRDADAALYRAKNQGRNRVVIFDPCLVPQA